MSAKKEDWSNAISKCECCFCCLLLHMFFFFSFSLGYFLTGNFVCGYFLQCIGKVGKVQGFAANGDAIVSFGNKKYRLYPGALKKVRLACMCLWVVVCSNCPLRFGKCDADMCLWGVCLNCPLRLGKMWLWHVPVGCCLFRLSPETWNSVTLTCACGLCLFELSSEILKHVKLACACGLCLFKLLSEICKNVTLTCACGLLSVHTVLWDLEKCDTHMCLWVTCLFRLSTEILKNVTHAYMCLWVVCSFEEKKIDTDMCCV